MGGCWCIRKKDRKRRNIKPNWLCNCWFDISCLNDYNIHGGDSVREEQSRVQTWGCVWGRWKEGEKERVFKIEHRFLLKNSPAASHCQSGANRFSWMLWLGVCVIRNKKTERTFFRRYKKSLLPLFHPFFSSRFFFVPSFNTSVHPPILRDRGAYLKWSGGFGLGPNGARWPEWHMGQDDGIICCLINQLT